MLLHGRDILNDDDFQRISVAVRRHCGINLHEGKKELVRGRLGKQLREGGFSDASTYLRAVLANPNGEEFSRLIDALSTNLTGFYREPAHFEYLQNRLLPELVRTKAATRRVRAWSAGCSSGQEAYSLAILLHAAFEKLDRWDVKVLASDVSRRMLRTARAGSYAARDVQPLAGNQRSRYFARHGHGDRAVVTVAPAARELVQFRYMNLVEPFPFTGAFDFIFCRNVMIYFDKPTQQTLVERFWDHLEPGGVLFTGHSESLTGISHHFEYVQPTIYRKATR